jgi:hypothetical protein
MIQHGWSVLSSDGEHVGVVFLVVGDENADIFDGLAITHHGGFAFHNHADRPTTSRRPGSVTSTTLSASA